MVSANSTENRQRISDIIEQQEAPPKQDFIRSSTEADSTPSSGSDLFLKGSHPHLQVLHFNDVYNITERSTASSGESSDENIVVAGASRFVTAFELHEMHKKLVLFSGDLFSPSIRKCKDNNEKC